MSVTPRSDGDWTAMVPSGRTTRVSSPPRSLSFGDVDSPSAVGSASMPARSGTNRLSIDASVAAIRPAVIRFR